MERDYNTIRIGQNTYQNSVIKGCRNCGGSGFIVPAIPADSGPGKCPVCKGAGEVRVIKRIEVIVEPII